MSAIAGSSRRKPISRDHVSPPRPTFFGEVKERYAKVVFLVAFFGMVMLSLRGTAGLALMMPALLYLRREDLWFLGWVSFALVLKMLVSYLSGPTAGYELYDFDLEWFIREPATLLLTLAWLRLGLGVWDFRFFGRLGPRVILGMIACVVAARAYYLNAPFLSGIDASQAVALLGLFMLCQPRNYGVRWAIFGAVLAVVCLGPIRSSFTVIAIASVVMCGLISYFGIGLRVVKWRPIVVGTIAFLMAASFFAEAVNLRGVRPNGEGNNGATRELLASEALSVLKTAPLSGTSMGYGIVPVLTISDTLGWTQYFDPNFDGVYNVYALSFHNGFWYLATRFGLFSILFGLVMWTSAPQRGSLPYVIFSMVMCLSISANVVVESIRAGPGVFFAFGVLFSSSRYLLPTSVRRVRRTRRRRSG